MQTIEQITNTSNLEGLEALEALKIEIQFGRSSFRVCL